MDDIANKNKNINDEEHKRENENESCKNIGITKEDLWNFEQQLNKSIFNLEEGMKAEVGELKTILKVIPEITKRLDVLEGELLNTQQPLSKGHANILKNDEELEKLKIKVGKNEKEVKNKFKKVTAFTEELDRW